MPLSPPAPQTDSRSGTAQPAGFASAAKALRAKIRACAARSFAARQGDSGEDTGDEAAVSAMPALLAEHAIRRAGAGRRTDRL